MSLTLEQPIALTAAAYQPIIYYANPDTTAGRPNYTARFTVTVDGSIIATYNATLNSDNKFEVDVSKALQSQLSDDIPTGSETEIISASNSVVKYVVAATEYWDVDGVLTAQSGSVTGNDHWAIPAAYLPSGSTEFLTDATYIYKNGVMWLGFLTSETTGIYAKINDGTPITMASGETIEKLALIPLNANQIGSNSALSIILYDDTDTAISETLLLDVYTSCYTDPVTLQFRNKYGVMDCYTFSNRTRENKAKRTDAQYNKEWFNYSVDVNKLVTLYGKYENDTARLWLKQLFASRYVYESGDLVRVTSDNYVDIDLDLWKPVIQIQQKDDYIN